MVFFNDPVPCERPVLDAVQLALEIRSAFNELRAPWEQIGHTIGLGLGVAAGYATLGIVGFQGRADYTAIGGVVNVASRLCDMAEDRQILISHRAYTDISDFVQAEPLGSATLKGHRKPIDIHKINGRSQPVDADRTKPVFACSLVRCDIAGHISPQTTTGVRAWRVKSFPVGTAQPS